MELPMQAKLYFFQTHLHLGGDFLFSRLADHREFHLLRFRNRQPQREDSTLLQQSSAIFIRI